MADNGHKPEVLVIPCSGVGKVHGLISREAVFHVTDTVLPEKADTVCLALLVTGDAETRRKVQDRPCVTLDGCPKLCALKNVELSGGKVAKGIRVYDVMKRHSGCEFRHGDGAQRGRMEGRRGVGGRGCRGREATSHGLRK